MPEASIWASRVGGFTKSMKGFSKEAEEANEAVEKLDQQLNQLHDRRIITLKELDTQTTTFFQAQELLGGAEDEAGWADSEGLNESIAEVVRELDELGEKSSQVSEKLKELRDMP